MDSIEYKTPSDIGLDESDASSLEESFMVSSGKKQKKDVCPVCGSDMMYKEKVDSYYCPKCRTFY